MSNEHLNKLPPEVIIWGGTGQAKVVRPILEHYGAKVVAVFDDTPGLPAPFGDIPLYTGWEGFQKWLRGRAGGSEIGFCVAIGNPHGRVRLSLSERLAGAGLKAVTIAHPTAWIADNAIIGEGAQILAGAIIMNETRLGRQCIINTKASVDHENILEDGVEIAPGATLCGCIRVRTAAWVCAGATVLPRLTIGPDAIVGAGAVVTKDVPAGATVVGVPAKRVIERK